MRYITKNTSACNSPRGDPASPGDHHFVFPNTELHLWQLPVRKAEQPKCKDRAEQFRAIECTGKDPETNVGTPSKTVAAKKRETNICDQYEGTVYFPSACSPFGNELISEVTGPNSTADFFFLRTDNFMATVKHCNLCKQR